MSSRGKGGKIKEKEKSFCLTKTELKFPVSCIHRLLRRDNCAECIGFGALVYLAAENF